MDFGYDGQRILDHIGPRGLKFLVLLVLPSRVPGWRQECLRVVGGPNRVGVERGREEGREGPRD